MLKCCLNDVFENFLCYFDEKYMVILRWRSETGSSFGTHRRNLNILLARVEPVSGGVGGERGNSSTLCRQFSSDAH